MKRYPHTLPGPYDYNQRPMYVLHDKIIFIHDILTQRDKVRVGRRYFAYVVQGVGLARKMLVQKRGSGGGGQGPQLDLYLRWLIH